MTKRVRTASAPKLTTDGKETSRELISDEITTEPVNKVIANGTYVAPAPTTPEAQEAPTSTNTQNTTPQTACENGTYVNSAGNTVCRPSSTNTGGATAICRDGTYSYSQSRRGTCSSHGGVKTWL